MRSKSIEVLLYDPGRTKGGKEVTLYIYSNYKPGDDNIFSQLKNKGRKHCDCLFYSSLDLSGKELYTNEHLIDYFSQSKDERPRIFSKPKGELTMDYYENFEKDKDGSWYCTCFGVLVL